MERLFGVEELEFNRWLAAFVSHYKAAALSTKPQATSVAIQTSAG
jgi:hypothetical protein